jgi:hypothetical protein
VDLNDLPTARWILIDCYYYCALRLVVTHIDVFVDQLTVLEQRLFGPTLACPDASSKQLDCSQYFRSKCNQAQGVHLQLTRGCRTMCDVKCVVKTTATLRVPDAMHW